MSLDQIVAEIEKLSPDERADLVDMLVEGMGASIDPEIERMQLDEIARRRSTPSLSIPAEEVFREVRQILDE